MRENDKAGISPPRAVNARRASDAYPPMPENLDRTAETINLRRYALNKVAAGVGTELGAEAYVTHALSLRGCNPTAPHRVGRVYPKLRRFVSLRRPGGMATEVPMTEIQIVRTEDAIQAFSNRLKLLDRSPATLATYRSQLNKLASVTEWLPCTEDDVVQAMLVSDLSLSSKAHMLRVLRSFFDYATQHYPGVDDPTRGITGLKAKDEEPRVLTREEEDRLVAAARQSGWQDYLLVVTFLDAAVRVGEMAKVNVHSIRDRWFHVDGKSGERKAPINPEIAALLKEHAVDTVIWRNEKTGEPFTKEVIKKRIRNLFDLAQIHGPRRGPHTLRHTSATRFIEEGGNVFILKEILGHKDVRQTEKYVHLAGLTVLEQHSRMSAALRFIERRIPSSGSSGIATHRSITWHAQVIDPPAA